MTSKIKYGVLSLALALALCAPAAAADFGLLLSAEGEYVSEVDGKGRGFTGGLTPWLSAAFGESWSLYLSGKLSFEREYQTGAWAEPALAELERTELTFRPAPRAFFTFGRQFYRDGAGMIASGLFDGLSGALSFDWGRLFIGGFYSGLQYKESAEILMTAADRDGYALGLDYKDLDTYFASRRVLVPVSVEFPDLTGRLSLSLSGLAQIDLNNSSPALRTQYLEARAGVEALDSLRVSVTGIGERVDGGEEGVRGAYAAVFTLDWDAPGELTDMVSVEARWGSGVSGEGNAAFVPVTSIAQGTILSQTLSGLANGRAFYTMRPRESFSVNAGAVVFWRTDLETFKDPELEAASEARFLGTEVYAALVWSPDSALRLSAGGGAFIPGAAFTREADTRWEFRAGVALAL
jgi:hypothetical protein